ncbi:MAG: hypothetical protein JSS68_14230 [Actinobacteria bacterium]|nr:hypothetical protein [Actinomycetota bacterium]
MPIGSEVIAPDGGLAGWLEHRDVLRAYATANTVGSSNGGPVATSEEP